MAKWGRIVGDSLSVNISRRKQRSFIEGLSRCQITFGNWKFVELNKFLGCPEFKMSLLHTKVPSVPTYYGFVPQMHIVKRAHNTAAFVPGKLAIIRQATNSNCVSIICSTSAPTSMSDADATKHNRKPINYSMRKMNDKNIKTLF